MAWLLVLIASVFEVAFAVAMKASFGFTKLIPSVIAEATGIASVVILSQALRTLPVGTAYAAWTGLAATGSGFSSSTNHETWRGWSASVSSSPASSVFGCQRPRNRRG